MVSQFKSTMNKDLKDQSNWCSKFPIQLLKFAGSDTAGSSPEEKIAALLLLMMNSDKIGNYMRFIGDRKTITVKEVEDLLKDLSGTNRASNELVMLAKKKKKQANKLKCYFCGEDHTIQKCDKFKAANPMANVFKKGGVDTELTFFANFLSSIENISNGRIFDSGSSIHVCSDKFKFIDSPPCEGEELTGAAGKVSICGIGKVVVNDITLTRVAYVPGIPFNLISISAATSNCNGTFTFSEYKVIIVR